MIVKLFTKSKDCAIIGQYYGAVCVRVKHTLLTSILGLTGSQGFLDGEQKSVRIVAANRMVVNEGCPSIRGHTPKERRL